MRFLHGLAIAALLLGGCVVRVPGPPVGVVYAPVPPPAPRTEIIGVAPGPEYFWVGGHYYWSGGVYAWRPGYWERHRPGHVWVPGYWDRHPHGHYWVEGHWR